MTKIWKAMLMMTVVTLVMLSVALFFLPDEVPLHFGATGAGMMTSKYMILLFTPVPALMYWAFIRKYKK